MEDNLTLVGGEASQDLPGRVGVASRGAEQECKYVFQDGNR